MNLQKQYEEYLAKNKSKILFDYTERGLLAQTFELTFWKDTIMPKIETSVTNVMKLESISDIDGNVFRDATKSYLDQILQEEIKSKCTSIPKEKIKKIFQVRPEIRMNKKNPYWQKTENARIDLLVTLHAKNAKMSKCVVVIELKINNGKPEDLGTFTAFDKNYHTLDLDMYGHKIYVSASLNKKGSRWAEDATKMESFTDNKI